MEDAIVHYGVPGMKWGVTTKSGGSEDHRSVSSLRKKRLRDMSNSELKTLNTRLGLEKNYKELVDQTGPIGKQFVTKALKKEGGNLVSSVVASGVALGSTALYTAWKNR